MGREERAALISHISPLLCKVVNTPPPTLAGKERPQRFQGLRKAILQRGLSLALFTHQIYSLQCVWSAVLGFGD